MNTAEVPGGAWLVLQAGLEARQRALEAALTDLKLWLDCDVGQVAIFDATNTTNERRQYLVRGEESIMGQKACRPRVPAVEESLASKPRLPAAAVVPRFPSLQINAFHGRYQYLFIESICTDEQVRAPSLASEGLGGRWRGGGLSVTLIGARLFVTRLRERS